MRQVNLNRKTNETDISLSLNIDGKGMSTIDTGCGFLDHMLTLFAHHSRMDLTITCQGDTYVDDHHTVEDVGSNLLLKTTQTTFSEFRLNPEGHPILFLAYPSELLFQNIVSLTFIHLSLCGVLLQLHKPLFMLCDYV